MTDQRKTLYGQSLIRNASSFSVNGNGSKRKISGSGNLKNIKSSGITKNSGSIPRERYWRRSYMSPRKPFQDLSVDGKGNGGGKSSSGSGSDNKPSQQYSFKLRSWVLEECNDGIEAETPGTEEYCFDVPEDSELVELEEYVFVKRKVDKLEQRASRGMASGGDEEDDGLTAEDIRGAVGGELISGFSGSDVQAKKEGEQQTQPEAEPAEPTAPTESVKKDESTDGDVVMGE
ncbi:uncharacterized protein ASCRUDRAFT_120827 [Ascoidea rubescens DSM 1968]|uniref:Uncharacterized protein n=1 Tax=Ascoidea rubescens DSM 1968 TaxID=1344418 RepID=A0A1D2VAG4_9ASCO|nr:hypothetical protein ASCRUDRAFT_120827 [Ascoidea rubescens DSM 1968]ODV58413.1 hypothetical protein ASCRUDRAFT_120827 [Ascoidea rubescens DSM 1968]